MIKEMYLKAAQKGDELAMNNLGVLYRQQNKEKKAEEMFLKSSQKGYLGGTYNLGSLYEKQKKYKKAKKYFKMIIDLGNENDPITKEAQEVYRKLVQAGY